MSSSSTGCGAPASPASGATTSTYGDMQFGQNISPQRVRPQAHRNTSRSAMGRGVRHPGLHDADGAELTSRLVEAADVETHVTEGGHGPPILLLHGFGDTGDCWRRVVPPLSRLHRVVAVDIPPFGRSGNPSPPDGASLVDWYPGFFSALLSELELDGVTLVGHSLGGAISMHAALEHPQAVSGLALIAPAGLGGGAPWWWHAVAGRPINWAALLRLPNPLAGQAIRAGMRGFLEERLLYDARRLEDVIDHFVALHGGRRQLERLLATGRSLIPGYDGTLIERVREI